MRQPNRVVGGEAHDRQEGTDTRWRDSSGRPARQRAECRAGRPLRVRQDHAGRGAPRVYRRYPAGRAGRGRVHGQRLRRGGGPPAALGEPHPGAGAARRGQGQPARHARVRGLHRGPAGRAAGGGRRAVHRAGHRRGGRPDPDALGGVRPGWHAARRGHHQTGPPAGRLRRGAARLPGRVRRLGRPAVPAGHRRPGPGPRPDRPAHRQVLRLLGRHQDRAGPGSGLRRPHR